MARGKHPRFSSHCLQFARFPDSLPYSISQIEAHTLYFSAMTWQDGDAEEDEEGNPDF
jgi:hypothetical protein